MTSALSKTTHEARIKHTLDRQVSMQQRFDKVRAVAEIEAEEREMSPSQRDRYVAEEIAEYQKPEIIRQALKRVKQSADEQREKRERRTYEIQGKSKIRGNLKTQKKVRAQSANLTAKKAGQATFAETTNQDGMNQLIADLNVSYE